MNVHKPIPHSLSQWGSGTEVLYQCPKCGTNLAILGNNEKYCHECGNKLDWSDSPKYCSEDFKKKYDELRYKQYAFVRGKEPKDEELRKLLWQFYKGEFR